MQRIWKLLKCYISFLSSSYRFNPTFRFESRSIEKFTQVLIALLHSSSLSLILHQLFFSFVWDWIMIIQFHFLLTFRIITRISYNKKIGTEKKGINFLTLSVIKSVWNLVRFFLSTIIEINVLPVVSLSHIKYLHEIKSIFFDENIKMREMQVEFESWWCRWRERRWNEQKICYVMTFVPFVYIFLVVLLLQIYAIQVLSIILFSGTITTDSFWRFHHQTRHNQSPDSIQT